MIVVTGLRRTGKTSFINVALDESEHPYIILDLRGLSYNPSHAEIVRRIEAAFNKIDRKWLSSLLNVLKHVKGVNVLGNAVNLEWGKKGIELTDLLDKVDTWAEEQGKRFLVAFDEIQLIRGEKSIPRLFAHVADTNRNVTLVVTGSEMGLLFGFLGFDDPESPLYGRHYTEIRMSSFSLEEAKSFLDAGFRQIGLSAERIVMNYAIQKLDGVVGWLTLFGARCRDLGKVSKEIVDNVVAEGGRLARAEALKIVKLSARYGTVLDFLAKVESANWTQIKAILEARKGRSLPNPTVADTLNRLVKTGFILKKAGKYHIADQLLALGIQQEPFSAE